MRSRLIVVLLGICVLSGCSLTGRLYPVRGPLSTQSPPPVYVAKITGLLNSGDFSVVLGGGEVCKGRWQEIPRPKASSETGTPGNIPATNLSAEWDTVYGTGFYLAHVLGAKLYARAVVTGNRGTILNVEMYRPLDQAENKAGTPKGVAKDNKENIYKLVF
jgi:hypothetical protein